MGSTTTGLTSSNDHKTIYLLRKFARSSTNWYSERNKHAKKAESTRSSVGGRNERGSSEMKLLMSFQYQRVTNGFFAFILAISSVTAMGPFIFSQNARALASVTVCNTGCDAATLQDAVALASAGGVITFASNINSTSQVTISKPLTINGAGFTLSPAFSRTDNSNNSAIGILNTSGVTINDLTIDGVSGTNLHGINAYVAGDISLNGVSLRNHDRSGLVVNGSSVSVSNVVTSGNGWHGINVDQGSGVTSPANLTINGVSQHAELVPDVYVDNTAENVSVTDSNNQYNSNNAVLKAGDRVYSIRASAPTILTPSAEQYVSSTPILNSWTPVSYAKGIAEYQVEYIYDDGHTFAGGPYRTVPGTQTSRNHVPNMSEQGGVTIRVRAIDTTGNFGSWSAPVHYYYDSIAPTKPVLAQPANGALLNTNSFLFDWSDSTDASPLTYEFQSSQDPSRDGNGILNGSNIWKSGTLPSSQIQSNGAPDGAWFYQVRARDAAGTYSQWSDIWSVVLDTQSPSLAFVGATPAAGSFIRGTVAIETVINDANPGPYNLRIENGAPVPLSLGLSYVFLPVNGVTNSYSWNTRTGGEAVADGQHNLRATTVDQAGNRTTIDRPVTVDNTRPLVTLTTPISGQVNPTGITLEGFDAIGLDRLTANLYDATNTSLIRSCSATVSPLGAIDGTLNCLVTGLVDGTYTVRANARDRAGNISNTLNVPFTIDTTAPVVALTSPVDADVVTDPGVLIEGSTGDAASYELFIDGILVDSGVGAFSSYNWDTTLYTSDSYVIELVAEDAAGNSSSDSATITLDGDPQVAINGSTSTTATPTITGTIDDADAALALIVDGSTPIAIVNDGTGAWSYTFPTLANGTYLLEVTATDLASNTDTDTATLTVTVPAPEEIVEGTDATPLAVVTPTGATPPAAQTGDVLGDTTAELAAQSGVADVEGANVVAQAADTDTDTVNGSLFGLAWYWWVLIVAAIAAFIAWLIAALRRRNAEA